ncbi:DNA helicase, partial [Tanacetum coccineum]
MARVRDSYMIEVTIITITAARSARRRLHSHRVPTQSTERNGTVPEGVSSMFVDIGDCNCACRYYGAMFWYGERLKGYNTRIPQYNKCCGGGKIVMPPERDPSAYIKQMLKEHLQALIYFLDEHNELVRIFRTARDKCVAGSIPDFKIRLYGVTGAREYDLPTSDTLGAIVFENGPETLNLYGLLFRGGRLFQQYVVGVYCCIEQNLIDYYRIYQNDIRRNYLSGVYDALHGRDRIGSDIGGRLILPRSFTGGPRYMYSHYLDALAICRILGNAQFFITFTCNVNWPKIKRRMKAFPDLTSADRADIVVRVFEQKVHDLCAFLQDSRLFGIVTGYLYTIEFQKCGLPHCHTLLWVKEKIQHAPEIDHNGSSSRYTLEDAKLKNIFEGPQRSEHRRSQKAYSLIQLPDTDVVSLNCKGLRLVTHGPPCINLLYIIHRNGSSSRYTLEDAKLKNIFEGVKVGSNITRYLLIIHVPRCSSIMGKWSIDNAKNLCRILRCFHLASGLKVNFSKSKLFGIGVSDIELNMFAYTLFCEPSKLPCVYLGLPIGANMNKSNNWKPIIDKFHNRLTSWKANSLSPDGRLTLLKSVLSALGTYYFSIFQAPKCVLNYLEQLRRNFFWGGTMENNKLLGLLGKRNTLWFQVIVSIHGLNGGIDLEETSLNRLPPGPWKNILSLNRNLLKTNIDLHVIFKKKVGNGSIFRFWDDIWFGGNCLKTTFARLYSLESNKQCLINERCSLLNGSIHFTWVWRRNLRSGQELDQLDTLMGLLQHHCPSPTDDRWDFTLHHSNMYSVSVMRKYIDSRSLLTEGNKTRWNKLVPIKINILAWRLINDRLPTRSNLDSRGIDLHSLLCP